MSEKVQVILDLSPDVQALLDPQGIDLPCELQQALPGLQISLQADPAAPAGTRNIVAIITATAALITALTPIILLILDMISPPTQSTTWTVEEHADGTKIRHLHVFSSREQSSAKSQLEPPKTNKP